MRQRYSEKRVEEKANGEKVWPDDEKFYFFKKKETLNVEKMGNFCLIPRGKFCYLIKKKKKQR